jgi:hypothetical protein
MSIKQKERETEEMQAGLENMFNPLSPGGRFLSQGEVHIRALPVTRGNPVLISGAWSRADRVSDLPGVGKRRTFHFSSWIHGLWKDGRERREGRSEKIGSCPLG